MMWSCGRVIKFSAVFLILTTYLEKRLHTEAGIRFTNAKCTDLDVKFGKNVKCKVAMIDRRSASFSGNWRMLQIPITNITIKFRFMKKSNGYRPILYDFKVDACKFLRQSITERKHPVINYVYSQVIKYSNMNHTCPYDHDLIVENLVFADSPVLDVLFIPGEYAFYTTWYAYDIPRADVNLYFTLSKQ